MPEVERVVEVELEDRVIHFIGGKVGVERHPLFLHHGTQLWRPDTKLRSCHHLDGEVLQRGNVLIGYARYGTVARLLLHPIDDSVASVAIGQYHLQIIIDSNQ